jgi:hypothetical protein
VRWPIQGFEPAARSARSAFDAFRVHGFGEEAAGNGSVDSRIANENPASREKWVGTTTHGIRSKLR